jgi:Spy/CpxP family protein refolding chaperone
MLRTMPHIAIPLSLALAAPAFGVGCACHNATVQSSSAEPQSRAPVASTAHGAVKLVGEALSDVPLTVGQRAHIDQLATDADARHADARTARRGLLLALADQVQAGKLDRAALGPKIDVLVGALQKAQPADRAAFEQLHALLNADQRVAFVDALLAHEHEHFGAMRGGPPLRRWAEDLKLTADQKSRLMAAFKAHGREGAREGKGDHHEGGEGRQAKILTAFKADHFVIDEVAPPADIGKRVTRTSERLFSMVETALSVLTPEQRALAAQKLRERADGMEDIGPSGPPL